MPSLELFLFGAPRFLVDGELVDVGRRKAEALFIYLVVTNQYHSRESLSTMFWPEFDQARAKKAIRQSVWALNQLHDVNIVLTDRERIWINPDLEIWNDIHHFQKLAEQSLSHKHPNNEFCTSCNSLLRQSIDLVKGEFLEGFHIKGSYDFDEWKFFVGEQLRRDLRSIFAKSITNQVASKNYRSAIDYGHLWETHEPLDEVPQQKLIELYANIGEYQVAIQQYERYKNILQKEIGVSPQPSTTALIEDILQKTKQPPKTQTENYAAGFTSDIQLPSQLTPFIGRESEISQIIDLIKNEQNRFLSLVGPGGVGKTRLSIEVGRGLSEQFADGIFFVPLAPVSNIDEIFTALNEVLQRPLGQRMLGTPEEQLAKFLNDKSILLILDNLEHVINFGHHLPYLLKSCPNLAFLITTRESLNIEGETRYDVKGLNIERDSFRLFLSNARRVNLKFKVDSFIKEKIIQICQYVEGLPLGIELAACSIKTLSLDEMIKYFETNKDFLEHSIAGVSNRHKGLRIVFQQSWERLTYEEQFVMKKLSVFRGDFSMDMAIRIIGADLKTIVSLSNKSLLLNRDNKKLGLHAAVQQYAFEFLEKDEQLKLETKDKHSKGFLQYIKEVDEQIWEGPNQQKLHFEVLEYNSDIREAWRWAVDREDIHSIENAIKPIYYVYYLQLWLKETLSLVILAEKMVREISSFSETVQTRRLLGKILVYKGTCLLFQSFKECEKTLLSGLEILQSTNTKNEQAIALTWMGNNLAFNVEEYLQSQNFSTKLQMVSWSILNWESVLETYQKIKESLNQSPKKNRSISRRDISRSVRGLWLILAISKAILYQKRALRIAEEIQDMVTISQVNFNLGLVHVFFIQPLSTKFETRMYLQKSLDIYQEMESQLGSVFPLFCLGYSSWIEGDLKDARTQLYKTLELLDRHRIDIRRPETLCILTMTELGLGEINNAHDWAERAIKLGKETGVNYIKVFSLCAMGEVMLNKNNLIAAKESFSSALHLIVTYKISFLRLMALVGIAEYLFKTKSYNLSLSLLSALSNRPELYKVHRSRVDKLLLQIQSHLSKEEYQNQLDNTPALIIEEVSTDIFLN